VQFDSEPPSSLLARENNANKTARARARARARAHAHVRVRVIEASELSVEDRVVRPICRPVERVGGVRCVVSDRGPTSIGEIERILIPSKFRWAKFSARAPNASRAAFSLIPREIEKFSYHRFYHRF